MGTPARDGLVDRFDERDLYTGLRSAVRDRCAITGRTPVDPPPADGRAQRANAVEFHNGRALAREGGPAPTLRGRRRSARPPDRFAERSWNYITLGYGHGETWWRQFCTALKLAGYDDVLSIEHEDMMMSPMEGMRKSVELLRRAAINVALSK